MSAQGYPSQRPMITVSCGKFLRNNVPVRVVLRKGGLISLGCSDITIEACREMVRRFDDWQRDQELVVQP